VVLIALVMDPLLKRVYISGTQGLSIFHQDSPDTYTDIADVPTNGGKTSFYVPKVKQFYAVHPKTDGYRGVAGISRQFVNSAGFTPAKGRGIDEGYKHSSLFRAAPIAAPLGGPDKDGNYASVLRRDISSSSSW
jgi:hypothetical protein